MAKTQFLYKLHKIIIKKIMKIYHKNQFLIENQLNQFKESIWTRKIPVCLNLYSGMSNSQQHPLDI